MNEAAIATDATIVLSTSLLERGRAGAFVADDDKENQECNEDAATVKTSNKVSQTGTQTMLARRQADGALLHCE